MGTYDTRGGQPISPVIEDGPCDTCGGDPSDCGCPECPICTSVGDPRCKVSLPRALAHASQLLDLHRLGDFGREEDDFLVKKAQSLRSIAGTGCDV